MITFIKLYLLITFVIILLLTAQAWWLRLAGIPTGNEVLFTVLLLCISIASYRVLAACRKQEP